jgi:hypothetical protein
MPAIQTPTTANPKLLRMAVGTAWEIGIIYDISTYPIPVKAFSMRLGLVNFESPNEFEILALWVDSNAKRFLAFFAICQDCKSFFTYGSYSFYHAVFSYMMLQR